MSCPTEMLLIIRLCNVIKNKSEFERKCLLSCLLTCWHDVQTSEILMCKRVPELTTRCQCSYCNKISVQIMWPCRLLITIECSLWLPQRQNDMGIDRIVMAFVFSVSVWLTGNKTGYCSLAAFTNKKSLTVVSLII